MKAILLATVVAMLNPKIEVIMHPICLQPEHTRREAWLRTAGAYVQHEYAKMDHGTREVWWMLASRHYGCKF